MKDTCRTCNHFRPHPDPMIDAGSCHRYAPRPCQVMVGAILDYPENITSWPTVGYNDHCGEYLCRLEPIPAPRMPVEVA